MMSKTDFESALRRAVLAAADDDDPVATETHPLPEAAIATLKEVCERYVAGCPFRVGDVVTPRRGYAVAAEGRPHVVVEIADPPIRNFSDGSGSYGSNSYGVRIDIRVAHIHRGRLIMHWAESWQFEPYPPAGGS
jgi:hypothetical protein